MIVFDVDRLGPWVAERTGGTYYPGSGKAIGLERNGNLVAAVLYDNCTGRSVQMHVASDSTSRWMTREYLGICFDYPFNQLKVNKIIGLVDSTNLEAQRFDESIGFVEEHRIKDAGRHGDLIIYSMTRDQCRWLHLFKGK